MTKQMQWANALSTRPSLEGAVAEVVSQIQASFTDDPDLGIVFLSSAFASDYSRLVPLLLEKLPMPILIGCGGGGIIGMKSVNEVAEIEGMPALSLTVACLPNVEIKAFRLDSDRLPDLDSPPQDWIDLVGVTPEKNPQFILLSDPMGSGINDLLAGLDFAYPQAVKVGGLASGNAMMPNLGNLFFYDKNQSFPYLYGQGTIGVALSGQIQIDAIVAQGCRPIGQPYQVSQGERNIITEILVRDDKTGDLRPCPPLDALRDLIQTLDDKDKALAQTSLFVGLVGDEFKLTLQSGDFLIRNLLGVDPRQGAIAIGDRVRPGQRMQFHLRDAQTSAEELDFLVKNYQVTLKDPLPQAALLFSCLGRGKLLYEVPNFDSELFRRYLNKTSLAGFFCSGEIGPIGHSTFLHGYTSVFAIIRNP
ncbi:MAG: FIST N-terminal domain-containing protein [Snowella sp.]|nr:FIST N-terminal domain-containing protein [Snowella sp.]